MCREMAHHSPVMHWNLQPEDSSFCLQETHSNLLGSWWFRHHSLPCIKSFHREKSAFLHSIPSVLILVENLDLTARLDAVTWTQGRILSSAVRPSSFKGTSTLVKMFTVSFQSIPGTRPLCLSSLWDGDSWRKKRTATGTTIPKKYNGNMSYKDSRAIMTSLIHPKTLHTFKYKAT